jgi:serine/threonine protein kinase
LSLDYAWPEKPTVSDEAKDLVERLLKLNPIERLGAGPMPSHNDFHQLEFHPFFVKLKLSELCKQPVQL